jgi:hypothetical protein
MEFAIEENIMLLGDMLPEYDATEVHTIRIKPFQMSPSMP